jgi:ketosteroid isomerase-like protein
MFEDNVDLVRTNLEEFAQTGRPTPQMSDEFVWDVSNYEGWPDRAVYEGIDEFKGFFAGWMEPFDAWTVEIEDIRAAGDDRVVVIMVQHGTLKGSTAKVDMRYGAVYTVQDGMIVRVDVYGPAERALEAVGLQAS